MPILDLSNSEAVARYEEFVASSPYGHVMQSLNWAKAKNNWDSDYVYLQDDAGNITAALSILSIRNHGEHAFMYAPRGPVCNFKDIDTVKALVNEAAPVIEKRNGFVLRMDPEFAYDEEVLASYRNAGIDNLEITTRGADEHNFSNPRMNMIADISMGSHEGFLKTVKSKNKSKIKVPYKHGLETLRFHRGDPQFEETLDKFYELTKIMAERQGITYRPKDYFVRLFNAFPPEAVTLYETRTAEHEVLSCAITLGFNRKCFYIYAASSNEKRNLRPNYQMNNEAIKDAIEQGYTQYDMGAIYEVDNSGGLYSFKKAFCGEGGLLEMIGQFDWVFNPDVYAYFRK
ncbi:lipid II:glycine glycyltransferase FemX [Varibaculum prostatecancerukia]|uniref:lipid II:glycine glycyltransferase FemX n=1 Tax=Varibaculum prostatecancerukia TaxID=2811781 RepID=UPI001C000AED|nr:peptidoglycan bridge formation glycyltransferase FemA/FemB family protein [Varibaculum prostatecancerukia]